MPQLLKDGFREIRTASIAKIKKNPNLAIA